MKKLLIIVIIVVTAIILLNIKALNAPSLPKVFEPAPGSWTLNLCQGLFQPATCEKVLIKELAFLSEEELRWWFTFQEAVNQGKYNQDDYEKFNQMTSLIDRHAAKIIVLENPIDLDELGEANIFISPRSKINEAGINQAINLPEKEDLEIKDGEFPNVHYDRLIRKVPTGDIVVGAIINGEITGTPLCPQRIRHNLLLDLVEKKIIYLDRERQYDANNCQTKN